MAMHDMDDTLTIGVEEEFFIVDAETTDLAPRSDDLVERLRPELGDAVCRELNRCQVEISTSVCGSAGQATEELAGLRSSLASAAAELGLAVVATATHPWSSWEDQELVGGERRYERMERRYQVLARQQIICGCHVHVGVADRELAIRIMNRSRPWLPVLLALSANSPFWHGVETGFDSYRTEVWQRWPTSGMPPRFSDRSSYDALVDELRATDALDDATNLYWYIRPSERWPTLEFRGCDVCLDVTDSVAIALLTRALVWTSAVEVSTDAAEPERSHYTYDAAMWRAARYGLGGQLLDADEPRLIGARSAVDQLLDHVERGLEAHGDVEFVRAHVERILARGNGATEQRRWLERAAGDHTAVVRQLVERTVASSSGGGSGGTPRPGPLAPGPRPAP